MNHLEFIKNLAWRVAQQRATANTTFAEEANVEATLLERIIELVLPALPSISTVLTPFDECGVPVAVTKAETLFVLANGAFAVVTDGALEILTPTEAAHDFGVVSIASGLVDALESQVEGKLGKRVAQSAARTAKLRAIVTLL
jgi:hypothetical protein